MVYKKHMVDFNIMLQKGGQPYNMMIRFKISFNDYAHMGDINM